MFISVLESLNQTESFVDGTSDWQIIHCDLPQNSVAVNNEKATKGVAKILEVNSVVLQFQNSSIDDSPLHELGTEVVITVQRTLMLYLGDLMRQV